MKRKIIYFIVGVFFAGTIMTCFPAFSKELSKSLEFAFNQVNIKVNGQSVNADNILYNNTTYVPLRKVAEMLGKEVVWDQDTKTANINDIKDEIAGLGIEFVQGDNVYKVLKKDEEVDLKKESFSIRFNLKDCDWDNGKYYAAQIASVSNQYNFDLMDEGKDINEIPYFSPATGMATSGPYEYIYIRDDAHHYIYYDEQDTEFSRAELINKDNDILNLEWKVNKIFCNGIEQSVKDSNITDLYIILFFDNNLNDVVDENEFSKVKIHLK